MSRKKIDSEIQSMCERGKEKKREKHRTMKKNYFSKVFKK